MLNSWLLLIISRWIWLWIGCVLSGVVIYKRLPMWRHTSAVMNIYFLHCHNLPFLRYIHCNCCLNLHIIHGDINENVSGCFFSEHSVYCVGADVKPCSVNRPLQIGTSSSYDYCRFKLMESSLLTLFPVYWFILLRLFIITCLIFS